MGVLQLLMALFAGISIGVIFTNLLNKYSDKIKKEKLISNINLQFKQILKNVNRGESIFKNRVNNTVFIGSELKDHGNVDIIYMMDNKDVAIFKNSKCIYTSESVNKEIVSDITETIDNKYKSEINDVVDILGFKFYREEFEKTFKVDFDKIDFGKNNIEISDIDKITDENELRFDIDEILDKIGNKGLESLTFEEKIFLDRYSRDNE